MNCNEFLLKLAIETRLYVSLTKVLVLFHSSFVECLISEMLTLYYNINAWGTILRVPGVFLIGLVY